MRFTLGVDYDLVACYQKPLTPLETVGADNLDLGKREVNEQNEQTQKSWQRSQL